MQLLVLLSEHLAKPLGDRTAQVVDLRCHTVDSLVEPCRAKSASCRWLLRVRCDRSEAPDTSASGKPPSISGSMPPRPPTKGRESPVRGSSPRRRTPPPARKRCRTTPKTPPCSNHISPTGGSTVAAVRPRSKPTATNPSRLCRTGRRTKNPCVATDGCAPCSHRELVEHPQQAESTSDAPKPARAGPEVT